MESGTVFMLRTIYLKNISNYSNHIICFIEDCPPRMSSISVVQVASVFGTESFSRSFTLLRDDDTFCYCLILCGVYAIILQSFRLFWSILKPPLQMSLSLPLPVEPLKQSTPFARRKLRVRKNNSTYIYFFFSL